MGLFILIYLSFYGSMHAYAFYKAKAALNFGTPAAAITIAFMLLMIFAPLFTRLAEHAGLEGIAKAIAWTGYTWMGALAVFVATSIIIGIYRLVMHSAGTFMNVNTTPAIPSAYYAFIIPVILTAILCTYGFFEALNIKTETITIKTPKLKTSTGPVRIVQVSDIHLGLMTGRFRLTRIIKIINEARPDILISTGDLIDGQIDNIEAAMNLFNDVNPRFGKYAVTGNHEVYAGIPLSVRLTEAGGFKMLRDQTAEIDHGIIIAGIDDTGHSMSGNIRTGMVKNLLENIPGNRFVVMLKHNPAVLKGTEGLFDLQLSGHLHGGQVFPFIPLVRIIYPYLSGLHKIKGGGELYISPGTGFWGPPMRIFARPEVTVIDIIPE